MMPMMGLLQSEFRKQVRLFLSYYVDALITQLVYILSFLLLSGLANIVTEGHFNDSQKRSFLVGYITWWVAGNCMMGVTRTVAEDAWWGTLEQVRISGASPAAVMATIIMIIFRLSIFPLNLGVIIIYLITLTGALGLSYLFTGLHIVYKNVAVLSDAVSFMFFFVSGVISPFAAGTALYILSRFLPLSAGIDLMRTMATGMTLTSVVISGEFAILLINSAVYLLLGLMTLNWSYKRAQAEGSLAHY